MNRPRGIRLPTLLAWLACALLNGCASVVKAPSSPRSEFGDERPETIRMFGVHHEFVDLDLALIVSRVRESVGQGDAFSVLVLSGGGANGAFGAGALVGLARAGKRPAFSIVTGVSAGALIAPFEFLGQDFDQELTNAYTGGLAEHVLQSRGLGVIFGSSAYRGAPLERLVEHYLTDRLIRALAREASLGRLLLIATTDVGTSETVIWDVGSIAINGGSKAKELIRDVLVASASVPGMFPPVIIPVMVDGSTHDEAHVDGTASTSFIVPLAFLQAPYRRPAVYIIVNGRLEDDPSPVRLRFRSIVIRSISGGLTHMMRTSLELTASTLQRDGAGLDYSAIPRAYPSAAPFDFRSTHMRELFHYGYECALVDRIWIPAHRSLSANVRDKDTVVNIKCPADDHSMGRFAGR
jgi:predicted acylesterase/phospholipase RssA